MPRDETSIFPYSRGMPRFISHIIFVPLFFSILFPFLIWRRFVLLVSTDSVTWLTSHFLKKVSENWIFLSFIVYYQYFLSLFWLRIGSFWRRKANPISMDFNEFRWKQCALSRQRMQKFSFDPWKEIKSLQPYLLSSLYRMRSQRLSLRCGCGSLVSNLVFLSLSTARRKR